MATTLHRRTATPAARRAEERALFERLASDRTAATRDAIATRFMPLARQLARRYRNVEDLDDLEQVAAIGLINAIDRFDPTRGLAFSSFAVPTILGELKRHLRDHGWSVRVPRDAQELSMHLDRASQDLIAQLGRSPTVAELADRTASTLEQVLEALQAGRARHAVSLDQPVHDDEPDSPGPEIAVEEAGFATAEDAVTLKRMLRELTEREEQLLYLRFHEDLTQSEIGALVGLSQMQVSRLLRNALGRLQTNASSQSTGRPHQLDTRPTQSPGGRGANPASG
jgi:RNA polymerase sigma-B factor